MLAVEVGASIVSIDIFHDVFIRPLHGTLGFIRSYQSVKSQVYWTPSPCFTLLIILWFYASCFCIVFPLQLNEKLNGQQTSETMSFLEALKFLFREQLCVLRMRSLSFFSLLIVLYFMTDRKSVIFLSSVMWLKLRACSHDPRTTYCPGATHWPRGQLCLGPRSGSCTSENKFANNIRMIVKIQN